jgi:Domain of unknown function (DUF4292)
MEKRVKRQIYFLLMAIGFIATIGFSSCKTAKSVAVRTDTIINPKLRYFKELEIAQPQIKTANISRMIFKMEHNGGEISVNMGCKVRTDSAIYISIQPFLGIEAFKIEMTPQKIRLFDKLNMKFYESDYSSLSFKLGVDVNYYNFQAALLNQLFCVGSAVVVADSCVISDKPLGKKNITFHNGRLLQDTEISLFKTVSTFSIKDIVSKKNIDVNYGIPISSNGINFPKDVQVTVTDGTKSDIYQLQFERLEFNNRIHFVAAITNKYTKGNIDELLKMK